MVCCVISGLEVIMFMRRDFAILWACFTMVCVFACVLVSCFNNLSSQDVVTWSDITP